MSFRCVGVFIWYIMDEIIHLCIDLFRELSYNLQWKINLETRSFCMIQTQKQKYIQDYVLRLIKNGMRCGDILPSIKDLSIRLNVSQMTVSRAMNDLESIGVLQKIHGKGTFVGGHELRQRGLPGYVQPEKPAGKAVITFLSPFHHFCADMVDFTRGVEDTIDRQKYVLFNRHVYISKTHEEEELADAAKKSAGIILISSYPPAMQHILCELVKKNYPIVLLDRWPRRLLCHSVSMDHAGAVEQGMREFYRNGHRRIVYLGTNEFDYSSTEARIDAYRRFMLRHELEPLVFKEPQNLIQYIRKFPKEPPTAVFANNDTFAYALIEALRLKGIRVPEDISVIGIDHAVVSGDCSCRVSSIAQPRYELGVKAVELLEQLLEESPPTYIRYFLPGQLQLHQSIKNLTIEENGK